MFFVASKALCRDIKFFWRRAGYALKIEVTKTDMKSHVGPVLSMSKEDGRKS